MKNIFGLKVVSTLFGSRLEQSERVATTTTLSNILLYCWYAPDSRLLKIYEYLYWEFKKLAQKKYLYWEFKKLVQQIYLYQGWAPVLFKRMQHSCVLFRSLEKNVAFFAFFAFFPVLYKRTKCFLRSFPFFIKERNNLCVLFRSL